MTERQKYLIKYCQFIYNQCICLPLNICQTFLMFIIAIKNPARGLWSSHSVGIPGRKFPPRRPGMDGSDDIIEQPDCCEASPLWGPAWHKINSLPTSGQLWQLKLRYIRHWSLARPALRRVVITQEGTQTHHPLRAGRLGGKNQEILQQHWKAPCVSSLNIEPRCKRFDYSYFRF